MGHACGHNFIATASLSAALAARAAVDKFGLGGKLILFGIPAEGTINFHCSSTH
jgi:metal-dependent amidase/aminoacylase/carboxypeptidase family protein